VDSILAETIPPSHVPHHVSPFGDMRPGDMRVVDMRVVDMRVVDMRGGDIHIRDMSVCDTRVGYARPGGMRIPTCAFAMNERTQAACACACSSAMQRSIMLHTASTVPTMMSRDGP
jgi:hypothetical protein